MNKTRNYVQVPCYLGKKQKENLYNLQEEVLSEYEIHIPIAELVRDSVAHFLNYMAQEDLENYLKSKGRV